MIVFVIVTFYHIFIITIMIGIHSFPLFYYRVGIGATNSDECRSIRTTATITTSVVTKMAICNVSQERTQ